MNDRSVAAIKVCFAAGRSLAIRGRNPYNVAPFRGAYCGRPHGAVPPSSQGQSLPDLGRKIVNHAQSGVVRDFFYFVSAVSMIKIRRGLDVPIAGAPAQVVQDGPVVRSVAILGNDYVGMKPSMRVKEGDEVRLGQVLFEDKKNPGVLYTAPAAGRVVAVNRGDRRVLQSVVIDIEGDGEESF